MHVYKKLLPSPDITHTPWLSDRSYSVDGNHRHMFYLTFGLPKQLRITFLFYLFILQTIFWVLYPSRAYYKGFFEKMALLKVYKL